jgi:serine/threonine protein kinase
MCAAQPEDSIWADRYRIERFLGEGERKQVYLASDLVMDRSVALSLIAPEPDIEPGQMSVTQWETYVMGQLGDHPNVVTIYDVGETDGHAYMVCQYMGGGDLRRLIKRASGDGQRVPLATVVRITAQVCDALAYAHAKGIVHRDVQPGNVWLDAPDGKAHLGDFDLAISTTESRSPPPSAQIVTTRAYLPPEEVRGEPFDERSDLYSLGATLYELCTNRPPFEGTDKEIIEQHLTGDPKPPVRLRPDTPEALSRLTLRLLEKNREDRPANAATVAEAVAAIRDRLGDMAPDVAELIAAGESHTLEFKSSLRFDLQQGKKNPALEGVVAKAVAGLMNAEGGTLLIGVDDEGKVVGIEHDISTLRKSPDLDGWERAMTEALIKHLEPDAAACISVSFSREESGTVAIVRCPPRSTPTWFGAGEDEPRFFARIGNSTRPLPAPFAQTFIGENWPR